MCHLTSYACIRLVCDKTLSKTFFEFNGCGVESFVRPLQTPRLTFGGGHRSIGRIFEVVHPFIVVDHTVEIKVAQKIEDLVVSRRRYYSFNCIVSKNDIERSPSLKITSTPSSKQLLRDCSLLILVYLSNAANNRRVTDCVYVVGH